MKNLFLQFKALFFLLLFFSCSKKDNPPTPPPQPAPNFSLVSWTVNSRPSQAMYYDVAVKPVVQFSFPTKIDRNSATSAFTLTEANGTAVKTLLNFSNADSLVTLSTETPLQYLTRYNITVPN